MVEPIVDNSTSQAVLDANGLLDISNKLSPTIGRISNDGEIQSKSHYVLLGEGLSE
jgi:hypothetical protein